MQHRKPGSGLGTRICIPYSLGCEVLGFGRVDFVLTREYFRGANVYLPFLVCPCFFFFFAQCPNLPHPHFSAVVGVCGLDKEGPGDDIKI